MRQVLSCYVNGLVSICTLLHFNALYHKPWVSNLSPENIAFSTSGLSDSTLINDITNDASYDYACEFTKHQWALQSTSAYDAVSSVTPIDKNSANSLSPDSFTQRVTKCINFIKPYFKEGSPYTEALFNLHQQVIENLAEDAQRKKRLKCLSLGMIKTQS